MRGGEETKQQKQFPHLWNKSFWSKDKLSWSEGAQGPKLDDVHKCVQLYQKDVIVGSVKSFEGIIWSVFSFLTFNVFSHAGAPFYQFRGTGTCFFYPYIWSIVSLAKYPPRWQKHESGRVTLYFMLTDQTTFTLVHVFKTLTCKHGTMH